ncbi:hypothetical protein [Acinetobacter baumannii]|uniref:hypothetical protein n=1 Tax=Acinetobacter baumannii TaxID=470 RepID=UPI000BF70C5E|nr:hypothetical protein [Acinetobacter baumannii]
MKNYIISFNFSSQADEYIMFGKVFLILLIGLAVLALILSFSGEGSFFLIISILLFIAGALVCKIFKIKFRGY